MEYMKPGDKLISDERLSQLVKHGFDFEHDKANSNEELKSAAIYLLDGGASFYPKSWSADWKKKFDKKTRIEKLVIAGALIAAEIDRLQLESA